MSATFLNIQVNFDKLYQFNLLRDNLTWQQLATVIQSSIPEAAAKESFSLYYTLDDGKLQTLHNQDEFSQLLSVNGDNLLGLRLYGETRDDMKSVYILPRTNDAFKKLAEFVDLHSHELESSFCLSRMVGILASQLVYAPENNEGFDEEFSQLEKLVNLRSSDRGEFRKMMKERKHLWKRRLHCDGKMSGRWARRHGYFSEDNKNENAENNNDNDNESFEFVGSDPTKEEGHGRRFGHRGRHGRGRCFRRCGGDGDDLAPKSDNCTGETDNKKKKAKHQEEKNEEGDLSSASASESEDACRRFGRRGGRGCHGGRGRRHHFDHEEFQEHSGEGRHGCRGHRGRHGHGRHGFGGPGFAGPGFGGPGFEGPGFGGPGFYGERGFGFGGKHHHHHHHREDLSDAHPQPFPHGFVHEGHHHHHGRKSFGGKKYFVFA